MDESESRKAFSGGAGERVPQVDPSDVKVVWDVAQEVKKLHPEGATAIAIDVYKARCTPGANISAITYRASMIGMLQHAVPEIMELLVQDKLDVVIRTAAEIPMKWIGESGQKGWPFDPDEFVRRVLEADEESGNIG